MGHNAIASCTTDSEPTTIRVPHYCTPKTRTYTGRPYPIGWQQLAVAVTSAHPGGGGREKRQRGGERRSVEAPAADTHLNTADERPSHASAGLTEINARTLREKKERKKNSLSRIQTHNRGWISLPQPASADGCGIYRSDPRAHLFVNPRLHRNPCVLHIWSPNDAAHRPRRHMWMF